MRRTVKHTECFERIRDLPRRTISKSDAVTWSEALSPMLRKPGSTATLRPWQAYCLAEAAEQDGGWFALPVGIGKTLLIELLPVVMNSDRSVLIIPAALRDKTYEDRAAYGKDWVLASPPPRILSREELAPDAGAYMLDQIKPDLILIDEADELANPKSSVARRIDRYVLANPGVRVVSMTGTPSRKTIMGYWHLLMWGLREGAPMPFLQSEAKMWAGAIDEYNGMHNRPGPLGIDLKEARAWFANRLAETPGVVIVDEDSCDAPLTITVRLARECDVIDRHYERFMLEQENPAGIPVSDPLSRWRLDGQLGCGLYLEEDPPPPEDWRLARRDAARLVRGAIEKGFHGMPLDTEAQVYKAYHDHPIVQTWLEIKPSFTPNPKTVWLSDSTVDDAIAWAHEDNTPGIIWCGGRDFAERLSAKSRLAYFRSGGKDANGRGLHAADPTKNMIVSWNANKRGFNLQPWTRQLIVHPPQSAKFLEQIFGRSHRAGQLEHVRVTYLATSGGTLDAFESAINEAGFARDTVSLRQKILRATIVRSTPTKNRTNEFRWARRERQ